MNKKSLTEADIRTKFILPNIISAGWNVDTQVREEVHFTDGRIYVRGRIHTRGERKRAEKWMREHGLIATGRGRYVDAK